MQEQHILKKILLKEIGIQHSGKNYILDKGYPVDIFKSYVKSFYPYIEVIKFGWTTWSLFKDAELKTKLKIANNYGIPVCLGGTLFEICYTRKRYTTFLDYIVANNLTHVELAAGFAVLFKNLPNAISVAKKRGLTVLVEIGLKNQVLDDQINTTERMHQIETAIEAGADFIILEAREAGEGYSVFKKDKSANEELLEAILSLKSLDRFIFEAPTRATQIALVKRCGPDVNMGNIPFDEIPRVETIRRQLHADTFEMKK